MAIQDDATKQLGSLPFGSLIGGPLVAAVEAQAQAARTTVEFIQAVAFKVDETSGTVTSELQTVEFTYERVEGETKQTATLTVPLLTIVPIPYIRIDDMTVDFKANISAESSSEDTTYKSTEKTVDTNITGKYKWGPAKTQASFSAAYSAKKDSSSARDSKYSVEYTMDIYIHAVNDDLPKGMETVLNILSESIKSVDAVEEDDTDDLLDSDTLPPDTI